MLSLFLPAKRPRPGLEEYAVPIYEYQCDACGARIESMHKVSDKPLKQCPECKEPGLRKLVSASAFRLKGSGWYETDFKKGSKKNLISAADDSGTDKEKEKVKEAEKDTKAPAAADKADAKESTVESKPAVKEKDKRAGKSDGGKVKTPKKAAGD